MIIDLYYWNSSLHKCSHMGCHDYNESWWKSKNSSWKYWLLNLDCGWCKWWLFACFYIIYSLSFRSYPSKVSQRNGHALASLLDTYLYIRIEIFCTYTLPCHFLARIYVCMTPLCMCISFSLFNQQHKKNHQVEFYSCMSIQLQWHDIIYIRIK